MVVVHFQNKTDFKMILKMLQQKSTFRVHAQNKYIFYIIKPNRKIKACLSEETLKYNGHLVLAF